MGTNGKKTNSGSRSEYSDQTIQILYFLQVNNQSDSLLFVFACSSACPSLCSLCPWLSLGLWYSVSCCLQLSYPTGVWKLVAGRPDGVKAQAESWLSLWPPSISSYIVSQFGNFTTTPDACAFYRKSIQFKAKLGNICVLITSAF